MRFTVCRILNLWVRAVTANIPLALCSSMFGRRFRRRPTRSDWTSRVAQTPKLETLLLDGRLDHIAGKVVGRASIGRDGADRTPGAELLRQLTAGQIASKRSEMTICLRLEYEYPHELSSR